jgi:hypothetical protein
MPATPFIGISIVVHILIIIFHKIFKVVERDPTPLMAVSKRQYALSIFIVTMMFMLMLATAVGLLLASVTERHSTVYLVIETAQWLSVQTFDARLVSSVVEAYHPHAAIVIGAAVLFIIAVLSVSYIRLPRTTLPASQGGHSVVQVSLLIGGVISVLAGITYIALYLLINATQ